MGNPCSWACACAVLAQERIRKHGCEVFKNYLDDTSLPPNILDTAFTKVQDEALLLTCMAYDSAFECSAYATAKTEVYVCRLVDLHAGRFELFDDGTAVLHGNAAFLTYDDVDLVNSIPPSLVEKPATYNKVHEAEVDARDFMQQYALAGIRRTIITVGLTRTDKLLPWTQEALLKRLDYLGNTYV